MLTLGGEAKLVQAPAGSFLLSRETERRTREGGMVSGLDWLLGCLFWR